MTKMYRRIVTFTATSALLFNLAAPAMAATLEESGNGAGSTSTIETVKTTTTTVVQNNSSDISNDISARATTGGNTASKNTGGDVLVKSGDATVGVEVNNTGNGNLVNIPGCGTCTQAATDVLVTGNGADSNNSVDVGETSATQLFQTNRADIDNKIQADAYTGKNEATKNTGGDTAVQSGDALIGVTITNEAGINVARVGGSNVAGTELSARILGNGADSHNNIGLENTTVMEVVQSNSSDIFNGVHADAKTGANDLRKNTGGSTILLTGDAEVGVAIDNAADFNYADVDCGCIIEDTLAKISGNGADSKNTIEAAAADALSIFQGNCTENVRAETAFFGGEYRKGCDLDNKVNVDAATGYNDLDKSTGDPASDPIIYTGDAITEVALSNAGNVNSVGRVVPTLELPGGSNVHFNFSFNLSGLMHLFGG